MNVKAVPNKYSNGRSFLCYDVPREPYRDGMGRPILGLDGQPKMQMEPAVIDRDLPTDLVNIIVAAWNASDDAHGGQKAEPWEHRSQLKVKHVHAIDGRVARFFLHDSRAVDRDFMLLFQKLMSEGLVHSAEWAPVAQGFLYVVWHPLLSAMQPEDDVPSAHLLWQGNRIVFGKEAKTTMIEPGTYAPDWRMYQRQFPDSSFTVVWP